MIKVITFDLDGTLWDVEPVIVNADKQVFAWLEERTPVITQELTIEALTKWRMDYYQQHTDLHHQISQIRIDAMRELFLSFGYNATDSCRLSEEAFAIFIDARHQVTLFENVVPMLEDLHGNYRLGALTNGNANIFKLDIGRYFDFSFSAEQLNASKPATDHFIAAQDYTRCLPGEIIHIGDHLEHDIYGAQQAGCRNIWFNPDQQKNTLGIKPDQTISCLSELSKAANAIQQQMKAAQQ